MEEARREFATPVGWYLAEDVAQLVGVSYRSIVEWTKHGYIQPHRDPGPPHVFSYQDVAEGMVVHELLDRNVKRSEIRRAIENMREEFGDWPLQTAPLGIYDEHDEKRHRGRLALRRGRHTYDIAEVGGRQTFLGYQALAELAAYLRRGGWVVRAHPEITHVEVDPEKQSGKPTIRGRRIPVEDVATMAQEGDRRILRREFGLTSDEINDAIKWAKEVAEFSRAA